MLANTEGQHENATILFSSQFTVRPKADVEGFQCSNSISTARLVVERKAECTNGLLTSLVDCVRAHDSGGMRRRKIRDGVIVFGIRAMLKLCRVCSHEAGRAEDEAGIFVCEQLRPQPESKSSGATRGRPCEGCSAGRGKNSKSVHMQPQRLVGRSRLWGRRRKGPGRLYSHVCVGNETSMHAGRSGGDATQTEPVPEFAAPHHRCGRPFACG